MQNNKARYFKFDESKRIRIEKMLEKEKETKRDIDEQIEKNKIKATIYEKNNDIKNVDKILTPGELKELSKPVLSNRNVDPPHHHKDFLQIRNKINFNHNDFNEKYNNIATKKKSETIKRKLDSFQNEENLPCKAIGYIKNIDEFVQMFNIFGNLISKLIKKNFQNITNYREIMGDGNCFFRAIMFKYFEFIIFYKRDDLFKDLIYEIDEMFSDNNMKKYLKINENITLNKNLTIVTLILIYNILIEEKDQEKSYLYFFLAINTCNKFDLSLTLYLRYILYKYIKSNEEKMFIKTWPVKIGNLLPEKFEDNGYFLFNKFYKEYLLTMYTFAEKLVIYIIPFIFGVPLNIFFYESNEQNKIQKFEYNLENYEFNEEFNLIYKANHYELTYPEVEIGKYIKFYSKYIRNRNIIINPVEEVVEVEEEKKEEVVEEEEEKNDNIKRICNDCKKPININKNNTELCENCLFKFLNEQIIKIMQNEKTINLNYETLELKTKTNQKYQFNSLLNIIINSSIPNKPIDKESFLKQLRKQFCILDMCPIPSNPLILPCGCSFHDMNCFRTYSKDDYLNDSLICRFCQFYYNFDEILLMFQLLCENLCCMCGNMYNNSQLNRIKYSYKYEDIKLIEHFICEQCKPEKIYFPFKCQCCKINHVYYENKNLN